MTAQPMTKPERRPSILAVAQKLGQQFARNAAKADEEDCFVADNYAVLKTSGLVEAAFPRNWAAVAPNWRNWRTMLRVLAHHCSSTALAFSMHTHQVAIPAWRWKNQKVAAVEPLLKRIVAERLILLSSGGSDWIAGFWTGRACRGRLQHQCPQDLHFRRTGWRSLMTGAVLKRTDRSRWSFTSAFR